MKKPEKMQQRNEKDGADDSWNKEAFYYNQGHDKMEAYHNWDIRENYIAKDKLPSVEELWEIFEDEKYSNIDIAPEIDKIHELLEKM